jgi:hypothetical protein
MKFDKKTITCDKTGAHITLDLVSETDDRVKLDIVLKEKMTLLTVHFLMVKAFTYISKSEDKKGFVPCFSTVTTFDGTTTSLEEFTLF